MLWRRVVALVAAAGMAAAWGCGDDDDNGGAAGSPGAGGTAGQAGQDGGAGEAGTAGAAGGLAGAAGTAGGAGEAGAAGQAGAAGTAGTAGAAGAGACDNPPSGHTECLQAGTMSAAHFPGKDNAKTACVACHTADLGKAAKNNCWECHDPASATNLHDKTIAGRSHRAAVDDPATKNPTNAECVSCHGNVNALGGNACTPCHQ